MPVLFLMISLNIVVQWGVYFYASLSGCLQARKLDIYFETEEKFMSKAILDRSIMDIITDPEGKTENILSPKDL